MKKLNKMNRFLKSLAYLATVHVFALIILSAFRLIEFLCLHQLVALPGADVAPAFLRGLWFDNVVACYVMVVPLAVVLAAACAGCYHRSVRRAVSIWFCALYTLVFAASAANIPYFEYFFKNINSGIFGWFGYTGTTAGMVTEESSYWLYMLFFVLAVALFIFGMVQLRRLFDRWIEASPKECRRLLPIAGKAAVTALMVALCIFGIRGRTGYNPIKISEAYYCGDSFLNQLGINPAFNLLTSTLDDMRKENKELHLMPYHEAIAYTRQWYGIKGRLDNRHVMRREVKADLQKAFNIPRRTNLNKPNVVFILMESMSASLLRTFGQQESLTPNLDSLYHHSLAFTHFYSAGIHTNHGLTASLYSFPALMFRNLMKGTVTPHRDGIPTVLKQHGYHNMFFMTHEAQYDNMNAFFRTNGYDDIYSQENYPKSQRVNAFGVSDHFLFQYALPVLNRQARSGQPFLATLLTISNHPPYVIPSWFKPKTKEKETQIVEYADYCIGDFLRQARKEPWYENTIFVILADHGKMVGKADGELPVSYNHIPLIIFGPGVKNQVYDGLGTQVDIMPTLLGILGVGYTYDGFGVDLLKQQRHEVFYSADNQIVARDPGHCYVYSPEMQKAFCYHTNGNRQTPTQPSGLFKRLRRYVFSMIQTAEYMVRQQ
jgi:phosphoglycerol transferase MdoB-like AlkP superfamily enzyme